MKNKIKIDLKKPFMMATIIFLLSVGCVSLDENPKDFPSPENFYSTESQIISALTGSMGTLYAEWEVYSYGWYEFHTDQNDDADLAFTANHGKGNWQAHYKAIGILNSVISALNEDKLGDTVPQEKKEELMGLAKFLRGFNYFFLVRLFGDVPIITEETDLIAGDISRQPVKDVYSLIEADFTVAISNLPDTWAPQFVGQPSKDAARGFLAKVYLTMATAPLNDASYYAKAKGMASDIMGNGVFSLIPDVRDVFKLENKLGPENIFSFNATEDDNATPPQIWLPSTMASGWMDFGLQNEYTDKYPAQPRKDAYMILEDWDGASWEEWSWRGAPLIRKFVYDDRETMEKRKSTANIPLLRYADVLMMFAEADNMVNGGPTQAAVDALNLIIDRANDGLANPNHSRATMGMSQSEFDDAVINERSLELFFEYDRWFDLIRKRILCEAVRPAIQVNCSDDDYLWPIPQSDLRINPLMTQNPGYPIPGDE